jgi:hypothetical protein
MNLRVIGLFLVVGVAMFSWLMTYGAWRYQQVAEGVVPIETRDFPQLTLVTVGTGGARRSRWWTPGAAWPRACATPPSR